MDSTRHYDEELSWDGQCYEAPQNIMPYYFEEPQSMPSYNMPFYYEDSYANPQYDMFYHYEESQGYQGQGSYERVEEIPHQEEPSLLSLVAQLAVNQAQIQNDTQLILQQIDLLQAHNKRLESQVIQQESLVTLSQVNFHYQPDFTSTKIVNSVTLESGRNLLEPEREVKTLELPKEEENFGFKTYEDACKLTSFEIELLNQEKGKQSFEYLMELVDDDFFNDDSRMKKIHDEDHDEDSSHASPSDHNFPLDTQIEFGDVETPNDQVHHDFVEISMDPFLEEPSIEVSTSLNYHFVDWAKHTPIKLVVCVEDPFFIIPPRDKFRSFQPYFLIAFERSFNNPLILKEAICLKGLDLQTNAYYKFGGRGFKWDLKVV